MSDPAVWRALYETRAARLRELAEDVRDEGARLVLLWAAHDYEIMSLGGEPDEADWRPN